MGGFSVFNVRMYSYAGCCYLEKYAWRTYATAGCGIPIRPPVGGTIQESRLGLDLMSGNNGSECLTVTEMGSFNAIK